MAADETSIIVPGDVATSGPGPARPSTSAFPPAGSASGAPAPSAAAAAARTWSAVPWRTILASVAVVLATLVLVEVLRTALRVVAWVAIAGFFAIVLAPLVGRLERRLGGRRAPSAGLVVLGTLAVVVGCFALFLVPVRQELVGIVTDLPGTVDDAASGRGPLGDLVTELELREFVREHEAELTRAADRLSGDPIGLAVQAVNVVVAVVSVTLLTLLFLTQSRAMGAVAIDLVPARRREAVARIARDAARAISGFMLGNLLISLVAGLSSFAFLLVLGIPGAIVLALWVAFTDLLPLVGATIGAAVCSVAAFVESPGAGIAAVVFFVLYQQVENGLIYPVVMARTVKVNPVVVLLAVLLGAELFGLVGALLAVPVSGAVLVTLTAVRQERRADHLAEQILVPVVPARRLSRRWRR